MIPLNPKLYKKPLVQKNKRYLKISSEKQHLKILKKRGRKPSRPVVRPNVAFVVEIAGGPMALSKLLGVSCSNVSMWLYRNMDVPAKYAKLMSHISVGIVSPKEINSRAKRIKRQNNDGLS